MVCSMYKTVYLWAFNDFRYDLFCLDRWSKKRSFNVIKCIHSSATIQCLTMTCKGCIIDNDL